MVSKKDGGCKSTCLNSYSFLAEICLVKIQRVKPHQSYGGDLGNHQLLDSSVEQKNVEKDFTCQKSATCIFFFHLNYWWMTCHLLFRPVNNKSVQSFHNLYPHFAVKTNYCSVQLSMLVISVGDRVSCQYLFDHRLFW